MNGQRQPHSTNLLLASLPASDLALLAPHLTRCDIHHQQVLVEPDVPIRHVYFLEGGIASVVSDLSDTEPTEIGLFGWEGMSGASVLLGVDRVATRTFIQVDGATAQRIEVAALRAAMAASPSLQASLLRYVQVMLVQVSHSAISNARHPMEARLARWLLMCHDRSPGGELLLTHEFMAMMIAAQRTGVTVTLHVLEGGGSIRSSRGRVSILDRDRLEELAGDAYGRPEAEYRRLIGPFGRSPARTDGERAGPASPPSAPR